MGAGESHLLRSPARSHLPYRAVAVKACHPIHTPHLRALCPPTRHRPSAPTPPAAPELLLGSTDYSPAVDMWAVGCILGELGDGQPLFPGDTEVEQLSLIQQCLGPLTSAQGDALARNPRFAGVSFPPVMLQRGLTVHARYGGVLSPATLHFMRALLYNDPRRRMTACECLRHPYLATLTRDYLAAAGPQALPEGFDAQPPPAGSKSLPSEGWRAPESAVARLTFAFPAARTQPPQQEGPPAEGKEEDGAPQADARSSAGAEVQLATAVPRENLGAPSTAAPAAGSRAGSRGAADGALASVPEQAMVDEDDEAPCLRGQPHLGAVTLDDSSDAVQDEAMASAEQRFSAQRESAGAGGRSSRRPRTPSGHDRGAPYSSSTEHVRSAASVRLRPLHGQSANAGMRNANSSCRALPGTGMLQLAIDLPSPLGSPADGALGFRSGGMPTAALSSRVSPMQAVAAFGRAPTGGPNTASQQLGELQLPLALQQDSAAARRPRSGLVSGQRLLARLASPLRLQASMLPPPPVLGATASTPARVPSARLLTGRPPSGASRLVGGGATSARRRAPVGLLQPAAPGRDAADLIPNNSNGSTALPAAEPRKLPPGGSVSLAGKRPSPPAAALPSSTAAATIAVASSLGVFTSANSSSSSSTAKATVNAALAAAAMASGGIGATRRGRATDRLAAGSLPAGHPPPPSSVTGVTATTAAARAVGAATKAANAAAAAASKANGVAGLAVTAKSPAGMPQPKQAAPGAKQPVNGTLLVRSRERLGTKVAGAPDASMERSVAVAAALVARGGSLAVGRAQPSSLTMSNALGSMPLSDSEPSPTHARSSSQERGAGNKGKHQPVTGGTTTTTNTSSRAAAPPGFDFTATTANPAYIGPSHAHGYLSPPPATAIGIPRRLRNVPAAAAVFSTATAGCGSLNIHSHSPTRVVFGDPAAQNEVALGGLSSSGIPLTPIAEDGSALQTTAAHSTGARSSSLGRTSGAPGLGAHRLSTAGIPAPGTAEPSASGDVYLQYHGSGRPTSQGTLVGGGGGGSSALAQLQALAAARGAGAPPAGYDTAAPGGGMLLPAMLMSSPLVAPVREAGGGRDRSRERAASSSLLMMMMAATSAESGVTHALQQQSTLRDRSRERGDAAATVTGRFGAGHMRNFSTFETADAAASGNAGARYGGIGRWAGNTGASQPLHGHQPQSLQPPLGPSQMQGPGLRDMGVPLHVRGGLRGSGGATQPMATATAHLQPQTTQMQQPQQQQQASSSQLNPSGAAAPIGSLMMAAPGPLRGLAAGLFASPYASPAGYGPTGLSTRLGGTIGGIGSLSGGVYLHPPSRQRGGDPGPLAMPSTWDREPLTSGPAPWR